MSEAGFQFTVNRMLYATAWFGVAAASVAAANRYGDPVGSVAPLAAPLSWAAIPALGAGIGALFGRTYQGTCYGLLGLFIIGVAASIVGYFW
jgi:hypothetical protein